MGGHGTRREIYCVQLMSSPSKERLSTLKNGMSRYETSSRRRGSTSYLRWISDTHVPAPRTGPRTLISPRSSQARLGVRAMPPRTRKGRHQVPHRISAVSGRLDHEPIIQCDEARTLVVPSSSLFYDLGRDRRVKAKPVRGRFASLDTAAMAKGGQLRGGRGGVRHGASRYRPGLGRRVHDRRAISVPAHGASTPTHPPGRRCHRRRAARLGHECPSSATASTEVRSPLPSTGSSR
jgi:hypothetical protein